MISLGKVNLGQYGISFLRFTHFFNNNLQNVRNSGKIFHVDLW